MNWAIHPEPECLKSEPATARKRMGLLIFRETTFVKADSIPELSILSL